MNERTSWSSVDCNCDWDSSEHSLESERGEDGLEPSLLHEKQTLACC